MELFLLDVLACLKVKHFIVCKPVILFNSQRESRRETEQWPFVYLIRNSNKQPHFCNLKIATSVRNKMSFFDEETEADNYR